MAESKIEMRLVRCPKCENLLPEPKDCSFFKCGGCGTILCAKDKNREGDSVSDNNNNRVKETVVSEEESDSDLDNVDIDHDEPCSKPNVVDSDNSDSKSGFGRFRKRNDSEDFFRFTGSNYFQDSISTDEAIKQDRAGLVRKLDRIKEQTIPSSLPVFRSGKHILGSSYYQHYQEPAYPVHVPPYGERAQFPSRPRYVRHIGSNGHDYGMLHESTCSCFHYDPYQRASGSVFPPSGLPDALYEPGFGPLHSPRKLIPQSRGLQRFADAQMNRVRLRVIRSLAGGAPFITCRNCSTLLKLPDSVTRKKQRIRCGSCSCTIEFSFLGNKKLVLLSTDLSSAKKAETRPSKLYYEFDSKEPEDDDISDDPVSIISEKAQEMQITDPTSPSIPEDELSSDSPSFRKLTPDSPLRDRSGPRSRSSRSISKRQNSMKEASVAIEMDESFIGSEVSQDSANDDQVRTKKKSGFTTLVKNSFKELKKSIVSSDVSINGNPVPERLVKIAEKQAGPIRPGNYWYDYRAGFWGVMGGHCLGILPPFIEELNYPMPEDCAHGNTRVFVNGRELHQKDLRLLAARGLPRDKDRSYTVYISGRVIDEDTGEELNSLGKLAPTVDKLKRGFGMRVPRRAA